jgi:nucleotide-binding universal stress UspA family protein
MMATQQAPTRQQRLSEAAVQLGPQDATDPYASPPIVAAVEPSTAHVTADTAGRLARELGAPLVFIFVRPRPQAILGAPYYQRQLTRDLLRGRKALDTALAAARRHGVMPHGEILEGDTATEVVEFARARNARLLVVVGQRRRRLPPSIPWRVIRASELPIVVAGGETTRTPDEDPGFFKCGSRPMAASARIGEVVRLRPRTGVER